MKHNHIPIVKPNFGPILEKAVYKSPRILALPSRHWHNIAMEQPREQDAHAKDTKAADPALAAALRENLLKRKQQMHKRTSSGSPGQWSGKAAQPVTATNNKE